MSLYQPIFFYPNGNTIDPIKINIFSCQIQGSFCVAYDLTIRKNSDNSIVYNTTQITLPTPLYNQQTLEIPINAGIMSAGTDYKWRIKLYWDSNNFVESGEIFFRAFSSPTLSMAVPSTINSNNYTFSASFDQTQGIAVKYFIFNLYDNNGILLRTSNKIYSANIQYNFDGFISNNNYKVQCIAIDQNDLQANTGVIEFNVSYAAPSLNIKPIATVLRDKNAIDIKWTNAVQINGQSTGSYTFTDDEFFPLSKSININKSGTIFYEQDIPQEFTAICATMLPIGFTGKIVELHDDDEGKVYEVGYDGVHLYYIIDGYIYIVPIALPSAPILIALRPQNIYIREL